MVYIPEEVKEGELPKGSYVAWKEGMDTREISWTKALNVVIRKINLAGE
jgi:hypothetical protein